MNKKKSTWNKVFSFFFLNTLLILLLFYIRNKFNKIDINFSNFLSYNSTYLLLSILSFIFFYTFLAIGWVLILQKYTKVRSNTFFSIFFLSQMFKYLPTSIFSFSSRIYFLKKKGVNNSSSISTIIIENLFILYSSFYIFLLFNGYLWWSLLALLGIILPYIIYIRFSSVLKKNKYIKHILPVYNISTYEYLQIWLLYLSSWAFAGLALVFLSKSMYISIIDIANYIAFQSISYTASIIAIFSPGGIGVREFILLFSKVPETVILNWRIITFTLDILFSIIAGFFFYIKDWRKQYRLLHKK